MMRKKTPHNFKFIKLIGEGSFSSVYLAVDANVTSASLKLNKNLETSQKIQQQLQNESGIDIESDSGSELASSPKQTTIINNVTNNLPIKQENNFLNNKQNCNNNKIKIPKYAIKVCQKLHIKRQGKQEAIMREKEIMNILNQHPNKHFIKLHYTFQDINRLYFVMTYAENGDLYNYMEKSPLTIKLVKKYTLQLTIALEHLHKLGIVHRDLKPENILLNNEMDIFITDFGSAQIYDLDYKNKLRDLNKQEELHVNNRIKSPKSPNRRNSFVGTAQYVSPEMLKNRQASNKSDLWAFGVIIYMMVTNKMPFNAPNEYLIYQKIQNLDYEFTEDFDFDAKDLVSSLIKLDPIERLGANDDLQNDGYISIRRHKFINSIVYEEEQEQQQQQQGKTVDEKQKEKELVKHKNDLIDDGIYSEYLTRTNSHQKNKQEIEEEKQLVDQEKGDLDSNDIDQDLIGIDLDKINPGLDEAQLLRLLTVG